jgi:hypothetical protein
MGQNNSKGGEDGGESNILNNIGKTEAEIVNLMMPIYFVLDSVSPDDLERAKEVWNMILNDTAPGIILFYRISHTRKFYGDENSNYITPCIGFVALKGTKGFTYVSCIMMFYDAFYSRLFDVHPVSDSSIFLIQGIRNLKK